MGRFTHGPFNPRVNIVGLPVGNSGLPKLPTGSFGYYPYGYPRVLPNPRIDALWKYPTIGTDFTYPLSWNKVPENILVAVLAIFTFLRKPVQAPSPQCLQEHGIRGVNGPMTDPGVMWITPDMPGASIAVHPVPSNANQVGPIVLDVAPAVEQHYEITQWLKKAPTVYVNLGSLFKYDEERANIMAQALKSLLDSTSVQVLWKMGEIDQFRVEVEGELQSHIDQERVVIRKWVEIDATALMMTGNVVCFAHHGGANSFNEALWSGVPQVIIPMWLDLYNFAQVAESIGVGVYATRGTAPAWTTEGLSEAFLRVVGKSQESRAIRNKAHTLGREAKEISGRHTAAKQISDMASVGQGQ
ncbi:UDP-glucoronosyl and UDP-glucosyl transferase [Colletotrichum truncatum]|uniref:UDP-glucoronosyl and UDP-glucosyl transferase n=1 Tax=Colletotrichum truncatum TaxID=5467 RepID=A0ACC3YNC0_COLTU|nr:UDP-glucoronosyl and UDP-glucosyl transferase [Colletotrichum truncatum]KAF6789588.1 UDP-glucoronosyl and UDP-glucosyl transferase [Colletotrichum truncatum]